MTTASSDTAASSATTFSDIPLHGDVGRALTAMRFLRPSPIQLHALPVTLFGNDVIGQAKSGTGKTAVFGVTAIEHAIRNIEQRTQEVEDQMVGDPLALILAPTREIAVQIETVLRQLAQFRPDIVIRTCIGGLPVAQDQVNLDLPRDPATYLHRVGRTGRFGGKGLAVTLLARKEVQGISLLARVFKMEINELPSPVPAEIYTYAAPEENGGGEEAEGPADGVVDETFPPEVVSESYNCEGNDEEEGDKPTDSAAAGNFRLMN
ncbi:Major Facilitator Superfamily (MFS) [Phytophthora nicotianae]|uniref:Major Facilitator Superfamily (MFS) n=1 Tax=Phytophthora nicotianae TaxID=4792 RepID=A0A0W8D7D8_PHYNI|nr:Major Facilitator Superfamily (MFS) [Phytophthora nicotianae]